MLFHETIQQSIQLKKCLELILIVAPSHTHESCIKILAGFRIQWKTNTLHEKYIVFYAQDILQQK